MQSSMAPADMMLEIFRALRTLQFEWKIVAQYALKCRPCPRAAALPPHEARPLPSNPNPTLALTLAQARTLTRTPRARLLASNHVLAARPNHALATTH